MCCVISWIIGFTGGVVPSVANWVRYDDSELICDIKWGVNRDQYFILAYMIVCLLFCFLFPLLIICYSYFHIYKTAKRHANSLTSHGIKQPSDRRRTSLSPTSANSRKIKARFSVSSLTYNDSNNKASKILLVMVVTYFICLTPFALNKILTILKVSVPRYVNTLAQWFVFINTCCNPIIYSIYRRDIRNSCKSLLTCRREQRRRQSIIVLT